ncbi:Uncharacterised protein [Legionella israelensis]|uniref:Uncharacterized protein n=1 Tax=Legionella israelensis TaxID=454 RepID=A0A0W0VKH4_9GAMM|nr:hypothetical protein Lisr_1704 [Legionella israelensis]SCY13400.1 hypothetical protein SAMN02746069_01398 [Legionella israelensis DSM 19235]STX59380.1 Uncharacterised protein [Legionella israelensis]
MKKILFGCRLVSCLMVLTLVIHWKVPVIPFQLILQQPDILNGWMGWTLYFVIMGALFFILNLIAAIGLFAVRKWGFKIGYLAIICSNLSGISYLPIKFFLSQPSIIPMIIINLVLLSYVIYLDISSRKFLRSSQSPKKYFKKIAC